MDHGQLCPVDGSRWRLDREAYGHRRQSSRDLSHTHCRLLAFARRLTVVASAVPLMLLAFSPFVTIGIVVVQFLW